MTRPAAALRSLTPHKAGVESQTQRRIILQALADREGRANMRAIYDAVDAHMLRGGARLSPQGRDTLRKTVNTYMVDAELLARVSRGWEITPAGREFLATGDGAEVDHEALASACRRPSLIQRLVRSPEVLRVKELYGHECQVCGQRLVGAGGPFAEAAHVWPLGRPHDGPDRSENVLCLCPNHHALFDRGAFVIADDMTIQPRVSIQLPEALRVSTRHNLDRKCLEYRRRMFSQRGTCAQ